MGVVQALVGLFLRLFARFWHKGAFIFAKSANLSAKRRKDMIVKDYGSDFKHAEVEEKIGYVFILFF